MNLDFRIIELQKMGIFLISLEKRAECWFFCLKRAFANFFFQNHYIYKKAYHSVMKVLTVIYSSSQRRSTEWVFGSWTEEESHSHRKDPKHETKKHYLCFMIYHCKPSNVTPKKKSVNFNPKKKAKKSLCLILGQKKKKKKPLPILFFKELVQAQTLLLKFQSHPRVITHPQTPLNP